MSIGLAEARQITRTINEDLRELQYNNCRRPSVMVKAIVLETCISHRYRNTKHDEWNQFTDGILFYIPRMNKLAIGFAELRDNSEMGYYTYRNQEQVEII